MGYRAAKAALRAAREVVTGRLTRPEEVAGLIPRLVVVAARERRSA